MAGLPNLCNGHLPAGLERSVTFLDINKSYEILYPITDFRMCHDGTPVESRILFTCAEIQADPVAQRDDTLYLKTTELLAKNNQTRAATQNAQPEPGPSTTTTAEIRALRIFQAAQTHAAPRLVAWKQAVQGASGPLPGGFITYVLMTKLPGESLLALKYWQLPADERDAIVREFLAALRHITALGIHPTDRGLRNVLWDSTTQKCSLIDFELWDEVDGDAAAAVDESRELQRWGLARAPPHGSHFALFNLGWQ